MKLFHLLFDHGGPAGSSGSKFNAAFASQEAEVADQMSEGVQIADPNTALIPHEIHH